MFYPPFPAAVVATVAIYTGFSVVYLLVMFVVTLVVLRRKIPLFVGLIAPLVYRKQRLRYAELCAIGDENDPERFLREIDAFLATPRLHKGFAQMAEYCRAYAYLDNGEFAKALTIYEQFVQTEQDLREKHNYKSDPLKAYLHHNLCGALLADEQLERAKEHYAIVKQLHTIEHVQRSPMVKAAPRKFPLIDARILMLEGQHEAARDAFEALLQDNERTKEHYDFHFHLAAIYETLGNPQQQREHLQQTIALGNQHYYVRIAQEKLAQLD
ncbi:MAG: hypothetical protein FWB76_03675 [Oscillospiraceae bacterium]|nr:hypothetical protein [Oscillospiraceae bacterium]